jgi:hypothetical protein
LNRKVLASASIAAVLTAPVAIAVADTNDTNVNPNHVPAGSTAQVSQEQRDIANVKQAAARSEMRRAEKAAKKAKAKKRAKKRAKLARAAGVPQAASGQQASGGSVAPGNLQAIAACESGGNPSAVGGGGAYRGKYQFDQGTWASVGGSGDPAAASEAEQDQRAAMLYSRSGASSWPVCGR